MQYSKIFYLVTILIEKINKFKEEKYIFEGIPVESEKSKLKKYVSVYVFIAQEIQSKKNSTKKFKKLIFVSFTWFIVKLPLN